MSGQELLRDTFRSLRCYSLNCHSVHVCFIQLCIELGSQSVQYLQTSCTFLSNLFTTLSILP